MTQSVKDEAKIPGYCLDDETAAVLEKVEPGHPPGAALLHDADHIRQAIRWRYKVIPMQLWISTWPCTFAHRGGVFAEKTSARPRF